MRLARQIGKAPLDSITDQACCKGSKSTKRTVQQHVDVKGAHPMETANKLPVAYHSLEKLDPSAKIKLQLFPIDEVTRMGLEKDGHHPYLELTLKARKRISSVLKHLTSKWGSTTVATGEPILFPYSSQEIKSSHCRWSLNDTDISAWDVYEAIGCPAVFRLRYGWVSDNAKEAFSKSFASALVECAYPPPSCSESCQQHEGMQIDCNSDVNNLCDGRRKNDLADENPVAQIETSETACVDRNHGVVLDSLADQPLDQVSLESVGPSSALWSDNLTNISIGGLFSEASLQGIFSNCHPKTNGSDPASRPSEFTSDSFDALIAAHVNLSKGQKLPSNERCSSILDAEDTCMAFPFKKSSSSGDFHTSNECACVGISSQDNDNKPCKFLKTAESNNEAGISQDNAFQESETALQPCSRVYNDESSLGLASIKWTDTLGPFDLGLPSGKISNGDGVSISGFVR